MKVRERGGAGNGGDEIEYGECGEGLKARANDTCGAGFDPLQVFGLPAECLG